ncbi:MAG: hypothetical protein HAW67_05255 [Endozoicomonadaceae bacterium]|nr:hypothetical protein [Endozoicomonadaceae bacterium]
MSNGIKDNIHIQIGTVSKDGFMIDPELAKVSDDTHSKLKTYFESDKHEGLKNIVLEITDAMVDDSEWYCLCCDPIDDKLDHIVIETKDFNELLTCINNVVE